VICLGLYASFVIIFQLSRKNTKRRRGRKRKRKKKEEVAEIAMGTLPHKAFDN